MAHSTGPGASVSTVVLLIGGEAVMSSLAIGIGSVCCAAGAVSHFLDKTHRKEGAFGLAAFAFLMAGMYLTRA